MLALNPACVVNATLLVMVAVTAASCDVSADPRGDGAPRFGGSSTSFWLNTEERRCGTGGWLAYLAAWPPAMSALEPDPQGDEAERRQRLRERLREELGELYDEPLPEVEEGVLRTGAGIWSALCSGCHGTNARGATTLALSLPVAPGDLTDPDRAAFFSERAELRIVAAGSAGTPMMAWKGVLSPRDLRAVIAHLETLVGGGGEQP